MRERTLSFVPHSEGFGYAVLEGSESLLDWGTRRIPSIEQFVEKTIGRYDISLIVVEGACVERRGVRALERAARVAGCAARQYLFCEFVTIRDCHKHFESATRHQIAQSVANFFPELRSTLPQPRRFGIREDRRVSYFIAVANALVVLRKRELIEFHAMRG